MLHSAPNLALLQWHNRCVLMFADQENDAVLLSQRRAFEPEEAGFKERDTRVFAVIGAAPDVVGLRRRFHLPASGFAVVLIGKDGSGKLHQTAVLTTHQLFSTIDAMPMRREEMRQRSKLESE